MTNLEDKLLNEPVGKVLPGLVVPTIVAQLVVLLYNIVDRVYLGHLPGGDSIIAAVGICAPIATIIAASANLFGRGGAPLSGIQMGRKDVPAAEHYLGQSLVGLIAVGVALMVVLLAGLEPILRLFGASDVTLPDAMTYAGIYCIGTIFVLVTLGMNAFIMTQGDTRSAMGTTLLGAVLNIVLDPIFIFVLGWGVAGAALATVLSQACSFVWVAVFFLGKRTHLRVHLADLRPRVSSLRKICVLGSSPFFMTATEGLLQVCFNRQLLFYGGDAAVGAMTIIFALSSFAFAPTFGIAQGAQPLLSHNYGARRYDRVREVARVLFIWVSALTAVLTLVLIAWPEPFVLFFDPEGKLLQVTVPMLRVYMLGPLVTGPFLVCQQTYVSLGEGKQSFAFAFLRKIILLIPLMYALPLVLDCDPVLAVVLAEFVSDGIVTVLNVIYFRGFMRRKLSE